MEASLSHFKRQYETLELENPFPNYCPLPNRSFPEDEFVDQFIDLATSLEITLNLPRDIEGDFHSLEIRRNRGAFYTPADATHFFWLQFFETEGLAKASKSRILKWLQTITFIDPASGAGIFMLSLIRKLNSAGLSFQEINENLSFYCIDINDFALETSQKIIEGLLHLYENSKTNLTKSQRQYLNQDGILFLQNFKTTNRRIIIVGNPPYIRDKTLVGGYPFSKTKICGNIYAVFVETAIKLSARSNGTFGMIVPFSLTFSKAFQSLRQYILESGGHFRLINFDNIPDSIFKFGKPDSLNSNKSNSQRTTFIFGRFNAKSQKTSLETSELISWRKKQRKSVLSRTPNLTDITQFSDKTAFPRVSNSLDQKITRSKMKRNKSIRDFLVPESVGFTIWVAPTVRYYISVSSKGNDKASALSFTFENRNLSLGIFGILISETFFRHWRIFGDGFHLTKENLFSFPITSSLEANLFKIAALSEKIILDARKYKKSKLNAGKISTSYDYRNHPLVEKIDMLILNSF